jgi:hypothetical protein
MSKAKHVHYGCIDEGCCIGKDSDGVLVKEFTPVVF